MPDELDRKADALAHEANLLTAATRMRARVLMGLLCLNVLALGLLGIGVFQAQHAASEAKKTSDGTASLVAIFADALSPTGCISKLSVYQRELNTIKVENDNRLIHDVKLLPLPKPPPKCKVPTTPRPIPTKTITVTRTVTRVMPGPVRTVTVTRCVRPNGRPC